MIRHAGRHEEIGEWKNCTFTFDKWDYICNHYIGDEPILIPGLMGKNYVSDICIDARSSIDVMDTHFFQAITKICARTNGTAEESLYKLCMQ